MKKTILTVLQVLVTLGILWFIFKDAEKRAAMALALQKADKTWLIWGFVAYGVVEIFATIRWGALLKVQGIVLGKMRLLALLMIGIFFNFFMPGGTGGDVVKIYLLLKETPGRATQAVLATLMDRLIGLISLISISVVFIGLRYSWFLTNPVTAKLLYSLLLILGSSVCVILFSFLITGFGLVHKLPARMPGRDRFIELSAAYNGYARAWKSSLFAFLLSWPIHAGSFLVFYFSGRAFAAKAGLVDFFAVMPVVNTITAMPISLSGVGVREKLFENLLGGLCAVPAADAVMISMTGFMVMLAWGMIGGVIYLFYRPTQHAPVAEMVESVHELEHEIAVKNEPTL